MPVAAAPGTRRRSRIAAALWTLGLLFVAAVAAIEWWLWPRTSPLAPDWTGTTVVLAGDGVRGWRDGHASRARFDEPFGIVASRDGTIFLTDAGDSSRIRVISPDGTVFALAGGGRGFADGVGPWARFDTPSGLALGARGELYVADTANNAVRRVDPDGRVTTIAGGGSPGFADGPARHARFNGPIGVAVDVDGRILVADTYNDRIRVIDADGNVSTLAGGPEPGFADGAGPNARFNTPAGIALAPDGTILVADTGNGAVRQIDAAGAVTTPPHFPTLMRPIGIAVARSGEIFVTDDRGRIVARHGTIAGGGIGFRDGLFRDAEFRRPSGIAILDDARLAVADSGNALVRLVGEPSRIGIRPPAPPSVRPAFDAERFGHVPLLWPVEPLLGPHEIAGTLGEARGEGAERLHSGVDVRIEQGTPVHAVRSGVVESPISNGAFGTLNEWIRVGALTYVHVRAGRARNNRLYDPERFVAHYDERGRLAGIRVKRGARFATGEVLASVNQFNHVHLNVGWPGEEHNPLNFRLVNFIDTIPPTINAVRLYGENGEALTEWAGNRLVVYGRVQVVVDAWDTAEGNRPGRRLGLYSAGYQVLYPDGRPVPGFDTSDDTIVFNRLAGDRTAANLIFAPGSGIPFYSGGRTRFLYTVTNTLADGIASEGYWDTSALASGDYLLRVWGTDASRNSTVRDVPVVVESGASSGPESLNPESLILQSWVSFESSQSLNPRIPESLNPRAR